MKPWWLEYPRRYLPDTLTSELIRWYGRRKLRQELRAIHQEWEAQQR